MMYWNWNGMTGWGWFAMSLGTILFWAVLVAVGVLLFRMLGRGSERPSAPKPHRAPEQTLAERFAHGEIDEDEYRHRLAVLRDGSRHAEHSP